MYICLCHGVTDSDIQAAVHNGANTLKQLSFSTGCGTQCGSCKPQVEAVLEECLATQPGEDSAGDLQVASAA